MWVVICFKPSVITNPNSKHNALGFLWWSDLTLHADSPGQNYPCCSKDARYFFNLKLSHFVKSHLAQNCNHVNNNNMENEWRKNMTIGNARCIQLPMFIPTIVHCTIRTTLKHHNPCFISFLPNFTYFFIRCKLGSKEMLKKNMQMAIMETSYTL
jgi:hypothetical protein